MRKTFAGVAVGVLSTWLVLTAIAAPNEGTAPATAADIRKLLEERREVLAKLVEMRQKSFESADIPFRSVLHARKVLFGADLDLARTPEERVAAREALLRNATELELTVQGLVDQALSPREQLLECQAERLQAQADLMTEQMNLDEKSN